MTAHPPLTGFMHFCMNLIQLRHASDVGKQVQCSGCGSMIVLEQHLTFGRLEWETAEQHVLLRNALEVLGIEVSRRKRRLVAAGLARSGWELTSHRLFWEAVDSAEVDADSGEQSADSQRLYEELMIHCGPDFNAGEWECIAEACVEPEPRIHPQGLWEEGYRRLCPIFRDLVPNPFVPLVWKPDWFTATVRDIAAHIYESREFSAMPILADALQDAGCDDEQILTHCRGEKPHARGCWVLDAILGRE